MSTEPAAAHSGQTPSEEERTKIKEAAQRITRGLPLALSIDNFLHTHQGDAEVVRLGKIAIGMAILAAERASALFLSSSPTFIPQAYSRRIPESPALGNDLLNKSWYMPFAQQLMSGVDRADVSRVFANLRFVIFNYDRCLEHFLLLALQSYFDMPFEEAGKVLNQVEFIHAYGSLGPLPWQAAASDDAVPLGGADGLDVWSIGSRIRTFTESTASDIEPKIKRAISEASTIILLGFGYLDQNVQLLTAGGDRSARRVMSTALDVSASDQKVISETMASLARSNFPDLILDAGSCRALFDNNRLQLSLR